MIWQIYHFNFNKICLLQRSKSNLSIGVINFFTQWLNLYYIIEKIFLSTKKLFPAENFSEFLYSVFFFLRIYPLRIMQPLIFLHEFLSSASLSAVPHVSSIFLSLPQRFFSGSFLALPVSFCLEDSILSPSWKSFSVPFWARVLATSVFYV